MSEMFPEAEAPLATPPPSLLMDVLARLDARRAAITAPTSLADAPNMSDAPGAPNHAHLRQALADSRWEVRAAAAHALGALADADIAPDAVVDDAYVALAAALHDEHRLVRAASVSALGRLAPRVIRSATQRVGHLALLRGALRDADDEPREAAVNALAASVASGMVGEAEARPLLLAAARDIASNVRTAAAFARDTLAARKAPTAIGATIVGESAGYVAANVAASDLQDARVSQRAAATRIGGAPMAAPAQSGANHAEAPGIPATRAAFSRLLALWGATWLRQTRIMRREVWLVMVCGALAAVALTLAIRLHGGAYEYAAAVAFILSGASATGVTFLAQVEHDPGLELTLATPVSLRFVLGGRIALVVGYNCALAVVASAVIALISRQSALAVIQGWVGPLLLLSAIALAISLAVGSATAVCGALLLDFTQLLRALPTPLDGAPTVANALDAMRLVGAQVWGAYPATLILVALLIIAAAILAPQRALKQKEA